MAKPQGAQVILKTKAVITVTQESGKKDHKLDLLVSAYHLWMSDGKELPMADMESVRLTAPQVVTVRMTVSQLSTSSRGTRVDPSETGLGFHLLVIPSCAPIPLEPGVEILATGVVDYSSLKRGPEIVVDDPTQIVFVRDLEAATPAP